MTSPEALQERLNAPLDTDDAKSWFLYLEVLSHPETTAELVALAALRHGRTILLHEWQCREVA